MVLATCGRLWASSRTCRVVEGATGGRVYAHWPGAARIDTVTAQSAEDGRLTGRGADAVSRQLIVPYEFLSYYRPV